MAEDSDGLTLCESFCGTHKPRSRMECSTSTPLDIAGCASPGNEAAASGPRGFECAGLGGPVTCGEQDIQGGHRWCG
jgi:hypothetical protein